MNSFKTFMLLVGLTLLLIFVGQVLGGREGMIYAFGLALVMNFVSYWFSDKIVLAMYRAKQVTEKDAPKLHRVVNNLCQLAQLPTPKVYIIPGGTPNAFATGRNPNHAAVAVTEGILQLLNEDELEGVLAHELAHIQNRDILIATIAAVIAGAITMLASMARWAAIFGSRNDDEGQNPLVFIVMLVVAPLAAMLIQMAISRSREYLADASGARMCGKPISLARALQKLTLGVQRIPMEANPATAHMFIVSPFLGGGLMTLFSTHPSIESRVAKLEKM
ncbi:MAG: zinc metalloprotease HtpX [bacterium]|nr:zinc metalloprotease HtpX [bacterium]